MATTIAQFKKALEGNNLEEAKKLLEEVVTSGISQEEQDVMTILYTNAYMKATNAVNKEYMKVLSEIEKAAHDLDKEEKRLDNVGATLAKKKELLEM